MQFISVNLFYIYCILFFLRLNCLGHVENTLQLRNTLQLKNIWLFLQCLLQVLQICYAEKQTKILPMGLTHIIENAITDRLELFS